ncbi:MAG: hypothetical protein ACREP6_12820 [Candidatus Binataceae bacterium]
MTRTFLWILGSLSPLEVLRGMADMSLRWWWHASPLIALAKLLLLAALVWGIVIIASAPGRGFVLLAGGALGLYVLRGRGPN